MNGWGWQVLSIATALDSDQQAAGERGGYAQDLPAGAYRLHRASDREARVALENLLRKVRSLAGPPQPCAVDHAVAKRSAVRAIAPDDRPRDADKLGPHFIAGEPNLRIAMTARVYEFEVRCKLGI